MLNEVVTAGFRLLSPLPCFRIYGRGRQETTWRVIEVYATHRRDWSSRLPLFAGTCITWTSGVIAVGWDFAERFFREQARNPTSREVPAEVQGGRLHHLQRRASAGAPSLYTHTEIMAHECGHTAQAARLGLPVYWLIGAAVTWFGEGPRWWNHFENEASAIGQFGGIVNGSVCERLMRELGKP